MVLNRSIQDKNYNFKLTQLKIFCRYLTYESHDSGEEYQSHNEIFFVQICMELSRALLKLTTQNTESFIRESQCKISLNMLKLYD